MEVDQGEGEFPSNYYYDYEFNLEQERRKAIEAKIAAEEEQKKTLKYKFNTLEKEDQWSLIGAACCVIGQIDHFCHIESGSFKKPRVIGHLQIMKISNVQKV